jgi:hypothetical protein
VTTKPERSSADVEICAVHFLKSCQRTANCLEHNIRIAAPNSRWEQVDFKPSRESSFRIHYASESRVTVTQKQFWRRGELHCNRIYISLPEVIVNYCVTSRLASPLLAVLLFGLLRMRVTN